MKMLHKRSVKIILLSMVAALSISTVGYAAYAAGTAAGSAATSVTVSDSADSSRTVGKEETVYVLANADGSAKKVIVSEWLKNPDGAASLSDYTELENVENVKGDESYSMSADNMRIWDAEGSDIYYQGTTDRALPVDVQISYLLDGKPISAEDLAGQSGTVTIRFDYTNRQQQTVTIDGEEETLSVPFMMLTGMILDNSNFTNITVSNGKVISDGDRSVVMGFAIPGLQDDLGLDSDKLEIPSSVEITADVENFSLTTTMTLATNDVFNDLNLDDVDSLDDLSDSLQQLSDASQQLVDGSSALYDGLSTLLDKSGDLISGIDQLADGAKQLADGTASLKGGADELQAGMASLQAGLQTLTGNSASLNAGAEQVFNSLLSMADSQLAAAGVSVPALTIDNYHEVLGGVLAAVDSNTVYNMAYSTAAEKVSAAVKAQEETIRAGVEEAVRAQVVEGVLTAAGYPMSAEEYAAATAAGQIPEELYTQAEAAISAQMSSDEIQAKISAAVSAKEQELVDAKMQTEEIQSQINAAVSQATAGSGTLQQLVAQLDSYNTFYQGLRAYTAGVDQAASGSGQLTSGAATLANGAASLQTGANSLYEGIGSLQTGSASLVDGVTELKDGSMQLSDGMKEFDEEGIQKLVDAAGGDLGTVVSRFRAILDLSKDYQSFAGIADGTEGSVKFIFTTDAIESSQSDE
jgi:putative membrane protein